jgi:hypothetical protein
MTGMRWVGGEVGGRAAVLAAWACRDGCACAFARAVIGAVAQPLALWAVAAVRGCGSRGSVWLEPSEQLDRFGLCIGCLERHAQADYCVDVVGGV